ncbi:hypothetical protein SIID45300_01538 [Candidatus Magnetaquicoccaceae bacterium FCR-1]|uniref:DUF523 domain-containing protein n=1 Tax=Candidatus Magnetaquiglobus chichijimensis TaxID=3141448 RepID=A0ABQ0C936_9PROT
MKSRVPIARRRRIAISACLLGLPVRYDGGHKAWPLIEPLIASGAILMPFCPENESGLGVPREPMRLEGDSDRPTLRTLESRLDHTRRLIAWSEERLELYADARVSGFICKARSPSCGVHGVPVHDADGQPTGEGMGLFARACRARFPHLPVEESERLGDWSRVVAFLECEPC